MDILAPINRRASSPSRIWSITSQSLPHPGLTRLRGYSACLDLEALSLSLFDALICTAGAEVSMCLSKVSRYSPSGSSCPTLTRPYGYAPGQLPCKYISQHALLTHASLSCVNSSLDPDSDSIG